MLERIYSGGKHIEGKEKLEKHGKTGKRV